MDVDQATSSLAMEWEPEERATARVSRRPDSSDEPLAKRPSPQSPIGANDFLLPRSFKKLSMNHMLENNADKESADSTSVEEYDEFQDAADRSGFYVDKMEGFEMDYFPEYVPYEADYVKTRNMILFRWKEDPFHFLSWDRASRDIPTRVRVESKRIWNFLTINGNINVGVFEKSAHKAQVIGRPMSGIKIVIVGAGAAGIIAGRQLSQFGFDVSILEARNRLGGRVNTSTNLANTDLGASIITGLVGNPLDDPYVQLKIQAKKIREHSHTYVRSTGEVISKKLENAYAELFNMALDQSAKLRDRGLEDSSLGDLVDKIIETPRSKTELGILDWFYANLEYACCTDLANVSLKNWDQDDEHDFDGDHLLLCQGYRSMIAPLAKGLYISYNTEVNRVEYSTKGVILHTSKGEKYQADAAIMTVPLGVLKDEWIKFEPPLPPSKLDSIRRLGFGVLNKVVLRFKSVFWDKTKDWIGLTNDNPKERHMRGYIYMFWNLARFCGEPILVGLCSGQAGILVESMNKEDVVKDACEYLENIFELDEPPVPVDSFVTAWKSEKYTRGSYSYIATGSSGDDYDELAKPLRGRLFFAGEATNRYHPATVAGAYQSGLREAFNVIRAFTSHQWNKPKASKISFFLDSENPAARKKKRGTKTSQQSRSKQIRGFVRLGKPSAPVDEQEQNSDGDPQSSSSNGVSANAKFHPKLNMKATPTPMSLSFRNGQLYDATKSLATTPFPAPIIYAYAPTPSSSVPTTPGTSSSSITASYSPNSAASISPSPTPALTTSSSSVGLASDTVRDFHRSLARSVLQESMNYYGEYGISDKSMLKLFVQHCTSAILAETLDQRLPADIDSMTPHIARIVHQQYDLFFSADDSQSV